jgi:1-acyl-sn-glycerol-3-phosphate acyltransferase
MIRAILRLLFRAFGWQADRNIPPFADKRCIMIAAPHTHLLDGFITQTAFDLCGIKVQIAIADKFAVWPIKSLMESMGAIWIDRSQRKGTTRPSYTDILVKLFETNENLVLVIAPEGTRSRKTQWRSGFYNIAKQANVPICFGYLDYKRKVAGVGGAVFPSDDIDGDMQNIMEFYKTVTPYHPERFSIDDRYAPQEISNES